MLPSLSIVIPTFNGVDHLRRLLPSVRRYSPRQTQVIIVDDASTDDTAGWLRCNHPWVELIQLPHNQGFCAAVNAGVTHAHGDVIELLNNDTDVTQGWAEAALAHFADPTVGSVAPLVLFMDRPNLIESAGQEYHICGWGRNRGYAQPLSDDYQSRCEVFGPSASSGFYRRKALETTGVMLPEFGAYYEDVDLSFRLRWAGYRCVYEPCSRVHHAESASYRRQRDKVVYLLARNEELVYWINLQAKDLLLGLLPHLGFLAVRAVRRTMAGQGMAYFSAKLDALRRWRWALERRRVLRELVRTRRHLDLQVLKTPVVLHEGWNWITTRKSA